MFKFASSLTVRCVHTYMTDGPVRPGLNTKDQTSCSEPGMLYVFFKVLFCCRGNVSKGIFDYLNVWHTANYLVQIFYPLSFFGNYIKCDCFFTFISCNTEGPQHTLGFS